MSPPSEKFGVLVLGYNRPNLLDRTLTSLMDLTEVRDLKFVLCLDGPKDSSEKNKVEACRDIFDAFAETTKSSLKNYSQQNLGLKDSVVLGISRAFEDKDIDYLIVLEDDCIVGPSTLDFFNWGFEQMSQRDDIGVVSGSYFGKHKPTVAFTCNRFSSWGWGTNRSVWQRFLKDRYSKARVSSLGVDIWSLTKKAPLPYRYEYIRIIQNLRKVDSWAIPFDMFLRSKSLLTIKPTVNQVQNIGFGADATHTRRGSSLSIEVEYLDVSKIQVASRHESKRLETFEAWSKLGKLTKEMLSSG